MVLRLLRGEDMGEVSREVRVAPPELERWRRVFLDGGQQGLKGKNWAGGELMRTRAKRSVPDAIPRLVGEGRQSRCSNTLPIWQAATSISRMNSSRRTLSHFMSEICLLGEA